MSIGSLYQFFPDKRAIIWALAERYTAESQACIASALADVSDAEGLRQAFSELVDIYYGLFLAEPVMRDIWSGTQADKALRELELADSRANAEFLTAVLKRLQPAADPVALETTAFLVWQMGEAAMRLAISVGRQEGDELVAAYKRMALRELSGRRSYQPAAHLSGPVKGVPVSRRSAADAVAARPSGRARSRAGTRG